MSPFEIIMLSCFGISWPISIYKSWKTGQSAGKSIVFMSVILVGYVAGVLHKIIYAPDFVVYLYVFNFIMVSIDLGLTVRNRRREPQIAIVRELD